MKKKGGTPIQIEGVALFFPIVQFGAVAKANVITSIRNPTGSDELGVHSQPGILFVYRVNYPYVEL